MESIDIWPIRLDLIRGGSHPLLRFLVPVFTAGKSVVRAPWEMFAMQLDASSAVMLCDLLASPSQAGLSKSSRTFHQDLLNRLSIFLLTDSPNVWRGDGAPESPLYLDWFLDFQLSHRCAALLARSMRVLPAVRSATILDPGKWILLRLDRPAAVLVCEFLGVDAPGEAAEELVALYVERLQELMEQLLKADD